MTKSSDHNNDVSYCRLHQSLEYSSLYRVIMPLLLTRYCGSEHDALEPAHYGVSRVISFRHSLRARANKSLFKLTYKSVCGMLSMRQSKILLLEEGLWMSQKLYLKIYTVPPQWQVQIRGRRLPLVEILKFQSRFFITYNDNNQCRKRQQRYSKIFTTVA